MKNYDGEEIASNLLCSGYSYDQLSVYTTDELEDIAQGATVCAMEARATMSYDDPSLQEYYSDATDLRRVIHSVLESRKYESTLHVSGRAKRVGI